jgi:hypothetical protein
MPRIPRGSEPAGSRVGSLGVPRSAVDTSPIKDASAQIADRIIDFTSKVSQQRTQALTYSYASNAVSEDLVATTQFIDQLKKRTPEDGANYFNEVQNFLRERREQRAEDAPSADALGIYERRFSSFRDRSLIAADLYENKLRTKSIIKKDERNVDSTAKQLVASPSVELASEFVEQKTTDIANQTASELNPAGVYSPELAAKSIQQMNRTLAKSLIDGYEIHNSPEMTLAFLGSAMPPGKLDALKKSIGFSEDRTLPYVDPSDSVDLVGAMTPGEVDSAFRNAVSQLRKKNKDSKNIDLAQVADLATVYANKGETPDLNSAQRELSHRIKSRTDMSSSQKVRTLDTLHLNKALGNAIKRAANLPADQRDEADDIWRDEFAKSRMSLMTELDDLVDMGFGDVEEAAGLASSYEFNAKKVDTLRTKFKSDLAAEYAQQLKEPATYWAENDANIETYQDLLTGPYTNSVQRAPVFEGYSRLLDAKFEAMKLNNSQKKYLTPSLSAYYSGLINDAPNAKAGMQQIFQLAAEFGPKANKVFSEMAERKHLSRSAYALTMVDPRMQSHAESLFEVMRDQEGYTLIKEQFDGRFGDQINLDQEIAENISDLRTSIIHSDPSGKSLYTIEGMKDLIKAGVQRDSLRSGDADAELTKWTNIILEPYKVVERNGSSAFTKWDTAKHHNALEDFLSTVQGSFSMKRFGSELMRLGLNGPIGPEPRWVDDAKKLEMPNLAHQKFNERLRTAIFVMNSSYDGLILKHTDTGEVRDFKDMNGKVIEIPISRLSEINLDVVLDPVEASDEQVKNILMDKFGTAF